MFEKFTLRDLIYITLMATIATVSKVPIRMLSNLLSSTVGLPGGVVGGVYYMFWIVASVAMVKKSGTATLFCIIQIFVSLFITNKPPIMLVSYMPPGIIVDLFLTIFKIRKYNKVWLLMILGALANFSGAVTQAIVVMQLPNLATIVSGILSAFSGAIGGYLAFIIVFRFQNKATIIKNN